MSNDLEKELFHILKQEIARELLNGCGKPAPEPDLTHEGYVYLVSEGDCKYRVRSSGRLGHEFNQWCKGRCIVTGMDWPWYYLTLRDPGDELWIKLRWNPVEDKD